MPRTYVRETDEMNTQLRTEVLARTWIILAFMFFVFMLALVLILNWYGFESGQQFRTKVNEQVSMGIHPMLARCSLLKTFDPDDAKICSNYIPRPSAVIGKVGAPAPKPAPKIQLPPNTPVRQSNQ